MNASDNGTHTSGIEYSDREQVHDLVYVIVTLSVATLSALVASFLGLQRRRRRHDLTSTSSVHGTRSGSDRLRQDAIRL